MQAFSNDDIKALANFIAGESEISENLKKKIALLKQKVELQEKFLAEALPIDEEIRKVVESEAKK